MCKGVSISFSYPSHLRVVNFWWIHEVPVPVPVPNRTHYLKVTAINQQSLGKRSVRKINSQQNIFFCKEFLIALENTSFWTEQHFKIWSPDLKSVKDLVFLVPILTYFKRNDFLSEIYKIGTGTQQPLSILPTSVCQDRCKGTVSYVPASAQCA